MTGRGRALLSLTLGVQINWTTPGGTIEEAVDKFLHYEMSHQRLI